MTLAAGYYRDPRATAAAFRDGWLHTGDLVRRSGDGFAYFVDRAKDMIKRSGENVSAREIERMPRATPPSPNAPPSECPTQSVTRRSSWSRCRPPGRPRARKS